MATLSRRTIALAGGIFEGWTRTQIEHFFYARDVPDNLQFGSSKLEMVMNVLRNYEKAGQGDKLLDLIHGLMGCCGDHAKKALQEALLRDGFAATDGTILDAEPDAIENRSAVIALVEKYDNDFDVETLRHHLDDCEELFLDGRWDSSIGHCRNFVEQLLSDVAQAVASALGESLQSRRPVRIREYLKQKGFFDESEHKKLVDGVYGYFSEEGSHPGISTHSAARVSKSILLSFAFYVLEKFDAWKVGSLQLH